jgi:hypothetical protein
VVLNWWMETQVRMTFGVSLHNRIHSKLYNSIYIKLKSQARRWYTTVPQQRAEEMKRTGIVIDCSPGGDRTDQVRLARPLAQRRAAILSCIAG